MFNAAVENEPEVRSAWDRSVNTVLAGTTQACIKGMREGVEEARRRHAFKNRTRKLENSIDGRVLGWSGDTFEAVIEATAPYASYVEETHPFMGLAYIKCEAVMMREIEVGIANAQDKLDR